MQQTQPETVSEPIFFAAPGTARALAQWDIPSTGDWSIDNAAGRARAAAVLAHMRARGTPVLLGHVMKAMAASGRWTGVEVGFCASIAEAAL
jgi:hypothetical protein